MFLLNDIGLWVAIWLLRLFVAAKLIIIAVMALFWLFLKHVRVNGLKDLGIFLAAWVRTLRIMFKTFMR